MSITAQQYAQQNNLPEWVEQWDEVTDLTGKSFEDISLEIAASIEVAKSIEVSKHFEQITGKDYSNNIKTAIKIKAKSLPTPAPAAGSLESIIAAAVAPYMAANNAIDEDAVIELIKQYAPIKHIEVTSNAGTHIVEGTQHKMFEEILDLLAVGTNPYLVGAAGTGKTQAAENAAKALGKPFYSISVCSQSTKGELFGFMSATGTYVSTLFRQAFEHGGVFLMDEVDNGNPNILNSLNAALANGYCAFPDAMVKRHEEFICVAAANTFGTGADRQYIGSAQLGAAFLDRFVQVEVGYDDALEEALYGTLFAKTVQKIRKQYEGQRVVISMRKTANLKKLVEQRGYSMERAIQTVITNTIPHNLRK